MSLLLSVFLGWSAIWAASEAHTIVKGGMTTGKANEYDKRNGARGIDPRDVVEIARRNGMSEIPTHHLRCKKIEGAPYFDTPSF